MARTTYDSKNDSMYLEISSKKAYVTVEVGERVSVDISESKIPVGVRFSKPANSFPTFLGRPFPRKKSKISSAMLPKRMPST